jgi:hypothetical protein
VPERTGVNNVTGRVSGRFQAILQCKIPMRGSLEFGATDDVLAFKDGSKGPLDSRLANSEFNEI